MIGEQIGNYRILSQLGAGGMGVVYLAEHTLIGQKVAVKVLLPEFTSNPSVLARFFNEAKATALIKHPGLVSLFDFGHLPNGSAYLVMEYLEGETLAAFLRRLGPPKLPLLVSVIRQLGRALTAAHDKGITHRDLKPDNIFLVQSSEIPEGVQVKVLDFGIAKLARDDTADQKTRTGTLLGTPAYMSPEQCRGAGQVDHRSDIYSLGCILYELTCGRRPFDGEGVGEILGKQIYEEPPRPRELVPTLPPVLEAIILRAMAKKPEARYQRMAELLADLDTLSPRPPTVDSMPVAMPAAPSAPVHTTLGATAAEIQAPAVSRQGKERKTLLLAAIGLTALAVAGIAGWKVMGRDAQSSAKDPSPALAASGSEIAKAAEPPVPSHPSEQQAKPTTPSPLHAAPAQRHRLRIESKPSGATVVRQMDGEMLGKTPLTIEVEHGPGNVEFVLLLGGYREAQVALPADRDGQQQVRLEPTASSSNPKPSTASSVSKRPAKEPKRVKKVFLDPFAQ